METGAHRDRVLAVLRTMKEAAPGLVEASGSPVRLRTATDPAQRAADLAVLTDWRNRHRDAFLTAFVATPESTARWLAEQVNAREDRILFMVEDRGRAAVGHLALTNFDFALNRCELDNVLKGDGGPRGAMTAGLELLVDWTFKTLEVDSVFLRVFQDNDRARALYERCGFVPVKTVPLVKREDPERTVWTEDPAASNTERSLLYMERRRPGGR